MWEGAEIVGHVAISVGSFRNMFLRKQPCVWSLVTWVDGTQEGPDEDYPPWTTALELINGHIVVERDGTSTAYRIEWVPQASRSAAWEQYGMHKFSP
ncbi:hypothetical protein VV01_00950 [Luteipulveratus halotolerans]|uniref:Uncharacterized protein n=2 Tax=Luteipulveratus halotolerans TaxID=1631356 RepID=A0A0L6CEX1_9MICO|nr:hypothetical protein VV01_00950 [Luteipulveratus halotolerans]